MPQNMSFSATTQQVRDGTKDVTRRFGWRNLKPGTIVNAVVKAMGLKKGEKVEVIRQIRILKNNPESLRRLLDEAQYGASEVIREGFPNLSPRRFVQMLLSMDRKDIDDIPQRIEFEYVAPTPGDAAE